LNRQRTNPLISRNCVCSRWRKSNSLENIGIKYPTNKNSRLTWSNPTLISSHRQLETPTDYHASFFHQSGFERPIVICSDNHDVHKYTSLNSPAGIKADPVLSIPADQERSPKRGVPLVRFHHRWTVSIKTLRSTSNQSRSESCFFSAQRGLVLRLSTLNPGLIAIIVIKGMGQDCVGREHRAAWEYANMSFSFLNTSKFKLPKGNKAAILKRL